MSYTRALAALHETTYGGVYYTADIDFADSAHNPTWTRLSTTGLTNLLIKVMQVDWANPYSNIYIQLDNDDIFHWNGSTWTKILDLATARTLAGITGSLGYIATDRITPGVIYIVINQITVASKVLKSTDYGATWNVYTAYAAVWVTGNGYISPHGNSVWLCSGDLYRAVQYSSNGGVNWTAPYDIWPSSGGGETINIDPGAPTTCFMNHEATDFNLIKAQMSSHTVLQNGKELGFQYQNNHADFHWFDYYTAGKQRILKESTGGCYLYWTTDTWATTNTPTKWTDFGGYLANMYCLVADIADNNNMLIGGGLSAGGGNARVYAKVGENMTAPWIASGANYASAPFTDSVPGAADSYIATFGLWVGEGPASSGVLVYADNFETLTDMEDEPVDPLPGDRGSWYTQRTDSNGIPHRDYHAEDVYLDTPQIHNPWPMTSGNIAVSDGSKLVETTPAAFGIHNPVTLGTDADAVLGLSTQQITLDSQDANKVFAGPTTGAAADPAFRTLVKADIPTSSINLDDLGDVDMTGVATGDIMYKTAGDYKAYPLGVGTKVSVTSNKLRFGNSSGGNYLEIDLSTGNLRLVGSATAWDDLLFAASVTKPGATAPSYKAFGPSGNLQALMFEAGHHDEVHFEVQLPHRWKEGSKIYPHVHWTPTTADAGNVVWELEYAWANINGTFGAPSNMATDATAAGGTAWVHKMTKLSESGNDYIDGTGKKMSSMLVCRLHRNSNAGSDTLNKDVALLDIDFHIEIDSFGSDEELVKDATSSLLLETGDYLLLETGDNILME